MAELIDQQTPLSLDDFRRFEAAFERPLPGSFRKHYMRDNGGAPAEEDVEAGTWGLPVHGFHPIRHGSLTIEQLVEDYGDLATSANAADTWKKRSFVPFAYDAGGHPIFMSLREKDYGCIYLHDPDGGNIFLIDKSFEAFRARLYREAIPGS